MPRLSEDDDDFHLDPDPTEMDPDLGNQHAEYAPCYYCKKMIDEQAAHCPRCGKYQSEEDSPSHTPLWIILTVIICGIVVLFWIFR